VGQRSWVTGVTTYPWPLHEWADVRVDPNPDSLDITSILQDAQAHDRWHPVADGYQPQPGDWVLFSGHVEVVTSYASGVLDSIGADSLPNLTVNAHSMSGPLADQGVVGFVDNGHLASLPSAGAQPAPAPASAPASASAGQQAASARSAPGKHENGKQDLADIPGAPGSGAAAVAAMGPAGKVAAFPAAAPAGTPVRASAAIPGDIAPPSLASIGANPAGAVGEQFDGFVGQRQ